MKMLMIARLPNEAFNAAVRDGSAARKTEAILEEMLGKRTVLIIVDLKTPSAIPALAEPWFLTFNAQVEFHAVMEQQALKESRLEELGKKWG